MKLYVCWTKRQIPEPGGHPCANAYIALREAGHDPDVERAYGWKLLPDALNFTPGRRAVKRLTGRVDVPVLVLDDGDFVAGSKRIVEWARANPA